MPLPLEAARALTGSPGEFAAAVRADVARARQLAERLAALAGAPDRDQVLAAFDGAFGALGEAMARASLARSVHPDPAMREAAEGCEQEADAVATALSLDRRLYDALAALDPSDPALEPTARWLLEKGLRDFRRAGVDRDEPTRRRIQELRDELTRIGQEFGRNIKDDVRALSVDPADLEGLPDDYRRARPPGPDGKVRITTENADYVPFITYSQSARAREALWRLYRQRGHPANAPVLQRMLARRRELAALLGQPSWAAYSTGDKMIGSAAAVGEFIARIAEVSRLRMERDYAQLLERKRQEAPEAERVDAWDSAFLQERVKAERYGFDSREVRPYFEYRRVKDGVLEVTGALFGIEWRPRPDAPVWHPDVEAYDAVEAGEAIGRIYLDMHPREGKYKHYAQFTLSSGVAGRRLPEGVLVCNFPRPGAEPALLEHGEVTTLFHEFGHLLHHLFGGRVRWACHSGVATEGDFIEAPSQMLEEWVWDPEVLARFARHVDGGQPIPADLVRRMKEAAEYGKGLGVRQQMFYAAVSLELHQRDPATLDPARLVAELQERYTPFRAVEGSAFHLSFGHLDGYGAAYYTYMWSLVIAKDLFGAFQREGLMDRAVAARYRRAILDPGGSRPAAELVRDFLGRPHDFGAYQAWLDAG